MTLRCGRPSCASRVAAGVPRRRRAAAGDRPAAGGRGRGHALPRRRSGWRPGSTRAPARCRCCRRSGSGTSRSGRCRPTRRRATRGRGCSGCPTSGRSSSHYGVPNDGAERVAGAARGPRPAGAAGHQRREHEPRRRSEAEPDEAVIGDYVASVAAAAGARRLRVPEPQLPEHARRPGLLRRPRAPARAARRARRARGRRPLFIKVAPFAGARELDSFLEAVDAAPFVSGFSVNLPPGDAARRCPAPSPARRARAAAERTVAELYRADGPRAARGDRLGRRSPPPPTPTA